MNKLLTAIAMLLLNTWAACACQAFLYSYYTLPDLTIDAAVIAEGKVAVEKGQPVLSISKVLKGSAEESLVILVRQPGLHVPVSFPENTTLVLFLGQPSDGHATLVGYEGQAIWPKPDSRTTYGRVNVPAIERIVAATLKAMSGADFAAKAPSIVEMLKSQDELMQMSGLDLALSIRLSESIPQKQRHEARSTLAAHALRLLRSANPEIRDRAILLVANAPNSVVATAVIPLITDPDVNCRRQARTALSRVVADNKIDDATIRGWMPSPETAGRSGDSYDLPGIQLKFQQVWEDKKPAQLARDLPLIRAGLKSTSAVERESAGIYLDYLGIAHE